MCIQCFVAEPYIRFVQVYIVDWEIFMLETIRLKFFLVLHVCGSFNPQKFINI